MDSVTFGDGIPVTWELFKDIEGTEPLDVVHAVYDSYLHVSIDTDVYKNAVLIPLIQEESGTGGMGSEEWYIDENPDFDYLKVSRLQMLYMVSPASKLWYIVAIQQIEW